MSRLGAAELVQLARGAGFPSSQARIMAAIALAESGGDPNAVGDTSLTTATWGPSIGLWQVRSLKAHRGTGRERDELILRDPQANARSARVIFGQQGYRAWSVYSSGAYGKHLPAVDAALAGGASSSSGEHVLDRFHGGLIPGIGDPLDGIGGAGVKAGAGALDGLEAVGTFFAALGDRGTWVRILQVVGGAGLIVGGLAFLGKDIAKPLVGVAAQAHPAGRAASAATAVASAAK